MVWEVIRIKHLVVLAAAALIMMTACTHSTPLPVPTAHASEPVRRATAYVVNDWSYSVTPVNLSAATAGMAIRLGDHPPGPAGNVRGVAVTPDGATLYLAQPRGLIPIRTATNRVGRLIRIGGTQGGVAITPDRKTAYVLEWQSLVPVDLVTRTPGKPINVVPAGYGHTDGMAITPDGKTIYVVDDNGLVPVSIATGAVGKPILIPAEISRPSVMVLARIVITPDGRTVYVSTAAGDTVAAVSTATGKVSRVIRVGTRNYGATTAIAIAPDGKTVYVADYGDDTVVPISTATNKAGKAIKVGQVGKKDQGPTFIAINPDGKMAYVATPHAVYPVNLVTGRAGKAITVAPPGSVPAVIAISQDGKTAWVTSIRYTSSAALRGFLTPIKIATRTPGKPIEVGEGPVCLLLAAPRTGMSASQPACNDIASGLPT